MVPVLLIANSIFSSIKERDYSFYAYKASSSSTFSIHRKWVKARTKINWHCIFRLCPVLFVFFHRHHHHHLIRCWIDHSDYPHIIVYILVSLYLKRDRLRILYFIINIIIKFIYFILENELPLYKDDMAVKNGKLSKLIFTIIKKNNEILIRFFRIWNYGVGYIYRK
jgi:hypothetical protein